MGKSIGGDQARVCQTAPLTSKALWDSELHGKKFDFVLQMPTGAKGN